MERLKICFVCFEAIPSKEGVFVGGTASNVAKLAKGLSQRGHKIYVLTSDINHIYQGGIISTSWGKIYPIPVHGKYGSVISGGDFLIKVICMMIKNKFNKKFDVIHLHSAYPPLGLITLLSGAILKIPKVFTLYSPVQSTPLNDRKGLRAYQHLSTPLFTRIFFSNVKLTAISKNVKSSLIKIGFKEKDVPLIPPPIDTDIFNTNRATQSCKREFGLSEDTPVILYCGNWAEWKGVDVLLESMNEVVKSFPEAKLITAWAELYDWYDDRKRMLDQRIDAFNLKTNIIEKGIVENMWKLMATADVFVAPFLNTDGVADWPLSILEAMACGTPVVATKVGGIPEIVKHHENGLLVEPSNKFELANAIIYMLENKKESKRMGINGAKSVSEKFKTERVVDELERVYEGVISNYSGNRRY